jgi:hypothetical protein
MEADLADRTVVVLDPGERTTVELTWGTDGLPTGEYTTSVNTDSDGVVGSILLSESFVVDSFDAPANATAGDTVVVNATVSNPNDFEATQTVDFRLSGQLLDSASPTLGPGESTTISFEVSTAGLDPGEYVHSVFTRDGGRFATLAVEPDFPDQAAVTFDDQESDGTTVTIRNVSLPSPGYVAIHDSSLLEGNVVGSVIGVSGYLEPGTYENVTVTLFDVPGGEFNETALTGDGVLIAMPHQETGDNQTYDFVRTDGAEDGPFTIDGQAVVDEAIVTVADAPDGNMTDGNVTDGNMTDGNMTDGMDDNMTDGNATDGNMTDGMDGNATDGNMTDGMDDNMTDGTDGNATDGMDGNMTDTPGDGNATDGNATDTPGDGNATDGNATDGTDAPGAGGADGDDADGNATDGGDGAAPPASDAEEDSAADGNATAG